MRKPEQDAAAEHASVKLMEKPNKFGLNTTQNSHSLSLRSLLT